MNKEELEQVLDALEAAAEYTALLDAVTVASLHGAINLVVEKLEEMQRND